MDISKMVGDMKASVVRPGDKVVVSIDRYLSGQQLAELGKYFQRRLPNIEIVVLQKGVTIEPFVAQSGRADGKPG